MGRGLLLLLALFALLPLLSLLLALALGRIEQCLGHVGLGGHLADGQRDRLLGCSQFDLYGVLLVL